MMSRHLPLITTRINFTANKVSPLPRITPRTFFATEENASRDLTPSVDSLSENEQSLPNNDHSLDDNRAIDDDGESELSDDLEEVIPVTRIPKPVGEPGRPNSGGYSLEDALASWSKQELGKVMVCKRILEHLCNFRT